MEEQLKKWEAPKKRACKLCGKEHQNLGAGAYDNRCAACNHDHAMDGLVCGCVDDTLTNDLWKILRAYYEAAHAPTGREVIYYDKLMERFGLSERYCYALLTILDNDGLIEHGTSIRGSWISERGEVMAEMPPPDGLAHHERWDVEQPKPQE